MSDENPSRAKWTALAMIGGGGSLVLAGAIVWFVMNNVAAGAALAALGAAVEATGVVRLLRTLRKS